jgi:hypothetical protein
MNLIVVFPPLWPSLEICLESYQSAPFYALSFAYQIYHCKQAAHRHGLQTVTEPVAHWNLQETSVNPQWLQEKNGGRRINLVSYSVFPPEIEIIEVPCLHTLDLLFIHLIFNIFILLTLEWQHKISQHLNFEFLVMQTFSGH